MSYTTHVTGEFTITPPLAWTEFKDSKFAPHYVTSRYDPELILRVSERSVDTEEGPLLHRVADALVMREIDEYCADGLLEQVQKAVNAFPGHEFSGYLECEGEDNTDIWRVYVKNRKAIKVEAQIVWPEP